jgi:hypothetical protein
MRFLKTHFGPDLGPVSVLTAVAIGVFVILLSATLSLANAQGGNAGTGTLPRHEHRSYARISGLLDPWATLEIERGEAVLVVASSHNAEGNLANSGSGQDASTMHASWRAKHMTITIDCPRLESDGPGSEGDQVQAARLARMVSNLQTYFPPDGTFVFLVPSACRPDRTWFVAVAPVRALPPLNFCGGARKRAA